MAGRGREGVGRQWKTGRGQNWAKGDESKTALREQKRSRDTDTDRGETKIKGGLDRKMALLPF